MTETAEPTRTTDQAEPTGRRERTAIPWVEVAIMAIAAVVAGLSWLPLLPWRDLAVPVLSAAVVASALVAVRARRFRPSALVDVGLSAVAFVVVAGLVLYRPTTLAGLPTLRTVRAIGDGLANGLARTLAASVPAPAIPAIRLVPFTVVWLAAFWGATLAIRSRSTLTPVLAAVAGFGFGLLVSGADDLVGLAGALVAVVVVFVVVRVGRFSQLDRPARVRRAWRAGLPIVAVVTLTSVAAASAISFASAPYDLHDRTANRIDAREAVTPLRQIQARMSEPKAIPMFDAQFDAATVGIPSFRLSVLDQFDGSNWSSSERFVQAASTLPPAPATQAPTQTMTAEITVHDLDGFWLPELANPVHVSLPLVDVGGISHTLATPDTTVAGLHYTLESVVARPTAAQLQDAQPDLSSDPSLTELPPGPAADVASIKAVATKVTANAPTPAAKLAALQSYLQAAPFRVVRDAPAGQSYARINRLLTVDRSGTSEQFATVYAVMARSLGFPTRVAAGFRHGPPKNGLVTVTSADAYAWPEVALDGLGWVPFDATPGAGDPTTNAPSSPAAVTPPADAGQAGDAGAAAQGGGTDTSTAASASTNPFVVAGTVAGLVLLAILIIGPLVVVALRARRTRARRRAPAARDRVVGAWTHAIAVVPPPPDRTVASCTAGEMAGLARTRFGSQLGDQLADLGTLANRARFDPEGLADDEAAAAWSTADEFRSAARRDLRLRTRVLTAIDPRTL